MFGCVHNGQNYDCAQCLIDQAEKEAKKRGGR